MCLSLSKYSIDLESKDKIEIRFPKSNSKVDLKNKSGDGCDYTKSYISLNVLHMLSDWQSKSSLKFNSYKLILYSFHSAISGSSSSASAMPF